MKKCILLTFLMLLTLSTTLFGQVKHEEFTDESILLMDGSLISGVELTNKVIIVNVWATWCKYCIKEIPDLNRLAMKYQNSDDVLFLAIAPDDADHSGKLKRFLEKNEFLFQQVAPSTTPIFLKRTEEMRYPTTIVYNKHGEAEEMFVGALKKGELKKIHRIINEFAANGDL
ncbi:MAG: TlpA family protein disulfide reductase [Cyclobacteriaceae bacterium]